MDTLNQMHKLKELIEQKTTNVIRDISPNDAMYADKDHYFRVGQEALKCIKLAMLTVGKEDIKNILDLPCGHGRVLRMLKAAFPNAQITACDLEQDAVDYCAKVFGATPVYSNKQPEQIPITSKFDLIWCGSLLTHLDSSDWTSFLNFFNSLLYPGGILVFSTHGRCTANWISKGIHTYGLNLNELPVVINDWENTGFGYLDYPDVEGYGISISSISWIWQQLEKLSGLRLLTISERAWDNHQDVIACIKEY